MNRAVALAKTACRLKRSCAVKVKTAEIADVDARVRSVHPFKYEKYAEFLARYEETLTENSEK